MSTRLLLFSLILLTIPIHAMKRSYQMIASSVPETENIVPDIENILIYHIIHYPLAKKPKEATRAINTLAQTNKIFNNTINNPQFNNNLIKNLADKLYCSHETIARMLWTEQSQKQLSLQYELKKLCCFSYIMSAAGNRNKLNAEKLDELTLKDINLEFTYNHDQTQMTPLMLAARHTNNMFDLLLEKKVNLNTCNSHGISTLNLLTELPIKISYCKKLLTSPGLIINWQNRHGESALLRCLIRRKSLGKSGKTTSFTTVITELLKAGADPKLASKYGLTPFRAAQQLNDERIINLIKLAIENKHSTS